MNKKSILVVDDEPDIRSLLQEILEDEGFDVSVARNAAEAREAISEHQPDLVLLDIWMPDEDGVSLLKSWKHTEQLLFPVIMISGHGTVETAVEATRNGAVDFIEKPVSLAKLLLTVEKAFSELASSPGDRDAGGSRASLPQLVGDSDHMRYLREELRKQAQNNDNLQLTGEPGTGRGLFAQHLHRSSANLSGRFIQLRCDSLSTINAQRELFGHEDRGGVSVGYLESASHGLLFLTDADLLPPAAQTALKQALENQSFFRVGGSTRVSCNVRIVTATRHDFSTIIENGFDPALASLLSQSVVVMRPLREHPEDISALLENFVNWHVDEEGLAYRHFTVAAQNRLRNLSWPGNLLELKNLVQRILILGGPPEIEVAEIDRVLGNQADDAAVAPARIELRHELPLREARAHFERHYLIRCLHETQGNIGDLAKHVGMERTHLYRKLRSLDIDLDKVRE